MTNTTPQWLSSDFARRWLQSPHELEFQKPTFLRCSVLCIRKSRYEAKPKGSYPKRPSQRHCGSLIQRRTQPWDHRSDQKSLFQLLFPSDQPTRC